MSMEYFETPGFWQKHAFNVNHPERKLGEIWWTNVAAGEVYDCTLKTARTGEVAYDCYGAPVDRLRPLFVQKQEILDKGLRPLGHPEFCHD
jgi:hypothetical protein